MSTISERVQRGAEWLDENEPDYYAPTRWFEAIDLDRLSLTSMHDCVLGQIWGNYHSARAQMSLGDTAPLGFNTRHLLTRAERDEEIRALRDEWVRVITERRAAA